MTVSIVTFYNNANYGSALQMYALSRCIEELGHNVYVLDFLNMDVLEFKRLRRMTFLNRLIGLAKVPRMINYRKLAVQENILKETLKKYRQFYESQFAYFSQQHISLNDIDMFITGSDQVWNIQIPNLHYVFYLRFIDRKKRMSYAASFGSDNIPKYNRRKLKKYLSEIRYISVREVTGKHIVKETCGKDATIVLDPVLLAGRGFWDRVLEKKSELYVPEKPYVFCYFLNSSSLLEMIMHKAYRDVRMERMFVCADTGVDIIQCSRMPLDPFEFVNAIIHAELILTDSFHATAFSLLYNKLFYVVEREYKLRPEQSDRLLSILTVTGTRNRYIQDVSQIENINWDEQYDKAFVNNYFEKERESSYLFLRNALSTDDIKR